MGNNRRQKEQSGVNNVLMEVTGLLTGCAFGGKKKQKGDGWITSERERNESNRREEEAREQLRERLSSGKFLACLVFFYYYC